MSEMKFKNAPDCPIEDQCRFVEVVQPRNLSYQREVFDRQGDLIKPEQTLSQTVWRCTQCFRTFKEETPK